MDRIRWGGLLLAIGLTLRLLGPTDAGVEAIGCAAGLMAWAAAAPWCPRRAATMLAGVVAMQQAGDAVVRLAILSLAILFAERSAAARAGAALAGSCAAIVTLGRALPAAWSILVEISRFWSAACGGLTGRALDAGPSASGMWILCLWIGCWLARRGSGERIPVRGVLVAVALVCVHLIALPWQEPIDALAGRWLLVAHHEAGEGPSSTVRATFLRLPVLFLALAACIPATRRTAPPANTGLARWTIPPAALLLVAGVLILNHPGGAPRGREVVVRRSDGFDVEVPAHGRYGLARAGMLGMLPRYLHAAGFAARFAPPPLTGAGLEAAAVLVIVLPTAPPEPAETEAIVRFVEGGGGLLVVADHTDLMGSMRAVNHLTRRWGIRARFDSAFAARAGWPRCLSGPPGFDPGIGTGCSLITGLRAAPLWRAPWAFADAGDRANAGPGAFFGDRRYRPGERVGDLVIAASARAGRGRVVVLGDGSGLQNPVLPWSAPWIVSLIEALSRAEAPLRPAAAGVVAIAAIGLVFLALSGSVRATCITSVALIAAAGGAFALRPTPFPDRGAAPGADRVAIVDASHLNRFRTALWTPRSIGGFLVGLQREGWVPWVSTAGLARGLPEGGLVVIRSPRVPLSSAERSEVVRHVRRGGTLLILAGGEEAGFLDPLLASWDVRIDPIPLGPVPVRAALAPEAFLRARHAPQFRNAWPVRAPRGAVSHYRAFDRDVAIEVAAGAGRVVVIADPDFATDRVLENEWGAWEGNVTLLGRLIAREPIR